MINWKQSPLSPALLLKKKHHFIPRLSSVLSLSFYHQQIRQKFSRCREFRHPNHAAIVSVKETTFIELQMKWVALNLPTHSSSNDSLPTNNSSKDNSSTQTVCHWPTRTVRQQGQFSVMDNSLTQTICRKGRTIHRQEQFANKDILATG